MCGIIGYNGSGDALPVLLTGLEYLEYRGYDSAGVALCADHELLRIRSVGKVSDLAAKAAAAGAAHTATIGVAHTRWATHGRVTEANAHPHTDCSGRLALVHNGIIENHRELRDALGAEHSFASETDSEVLAHLVEAAYKGDLTAAVQSAVARVRGTYALAVIHADQPDVLVAARLGSPLALGIGNGAFFVASDATPMLSHTRQVVFLDDGEVAEISRDGWRVQDAAGKRVHKTAERLDWNEQQAQKHGHPHFMIKEIMEQPSTLSDVLRKHLEDGVVPLDGLNMSAKELRRIRRVVVIACGTAYYASILGSYAFERIAGIPADAYIASEFRYRSSIVDDATLVIAMSQSGETADTLAAIREATQHGAFVRGILNVMGSTMDREMGGCSYLMAGPELSVCSTKAYTNMLALVLLHAVRLAAARGENRQDSLELIDEMHRLPSKIERVLANAEAISEIAAKFAHYKNFPRINRLVRCAKALRGPLGA